MLAELLEDVEAQFVERADDPEADDWRRRAHGYRDSLNMRAAEAKQLQRAAQVAAEARNRAAKAEQTDARRLAGERAVDRLINAHSSEFWSYLAEECQALGAELPGRVRKYLEPADNAAA